MIVVTDVIHKSGTKKVFQADSSCQKHGIVFEDDGRTGYFYARDYTSQSRLFVDALHLYNVEPGADVEFRIRIAWSFNNQQAALLIDESVRAAFDFNKKHGYSIDGFPNVFSNEGWTNSAWEKGIQFQFAGKHQ